MDENIDNGLNHRCCSFDLGMIPLAETDRWMTDLVNRRLTDDIPDMLLLLSHPPTLALGARELDPRDLLQPLEVFEAQGIYLTASMRGGGLTYHWPGQLICYPILKLSPTEQSISRYMNQLEEVGLRTLRSAGVNAHRRREKTSQIGLWTGERKIASMGIHVSRWVTSFGFALNLDGDLGPSRFIRPCGLEGVQLTSIEKVTGQKPKRQQLKSALVRHFQEVFRREVFSLSPAVSDTFDTGFTRLTSGAVSTVETMLLSYMSG